MTQEFQDRDGIRHYLSQFYPTIDQMPFCALLREGTFTKGQALCAEIVEVYRAFNTREPIKEIYLEKVARAGRDRTLTDDQVDVVSSVVNDERETAEHIDHLDMRLQLFETVGVSRTTVLQQNATLDRINREWVSVVAGADVFTAIAIFAAIEDWYTGIAGLYAEEYSRRGFSPYEVQTYSEHNRIEPTHASLQMEVLASQPQSFSPMKVAPALARAFRTSVGYDYMKLQWAVSARLSDLIERI